MTFDITKRKIIDSKDIFFSKALKLYLLKTNVRNYNLNLQIY